MDVTLLFIDNLSNVLAMDTVEGQQFCKQCTFLLSVLCCFSLSNVLVATCLQVRKNENIYNKTLSVCKWFFSQKN